MANIYDMISQAMQNPPANQPNPVFERAKQLAQNVLQFQKAQRAQPFVQALQDYGTQFGQATDDASRNKINQAANAARAAFSNAGGSAYDLPKNLWGANPQQGLQVGGEAGFKAPWEGDNLVYGQRAMLAKMQQDALKSVMDAQLTQAQTANYLRNANEPYSTGGSGSGGGSSSNSGGTGGGAPVKDIQWVESQARMLATADPRLASGEFSLPQLIDAHRRDLMYRLGYGPNPADQYNKQIPKYNHVGDLRRLEGTELWNDEDVLNQL